MLFSCVYCNFHMEIAISSCVYSLFTSFRYPSGPIGDPDRAITVCLLHFCFRNSDFLVCLLHLGPPWDPSGDPWGTLWDHLGGSWVSLGSFLASLKVLLTTK